MTANVIKFEDAAATWERDKRVMASRLAGTSLREIAEHENCSVDEVENAIVRQSGGVSPNFRERHMQLSLERLDRLLRAHYAAALKGNHDSSIIYLRVIEMSGRFLGLFPPPQPDAGSLEKLRQNVSSTEEIRNVLDELLGKNSTIDGEVVHREDSDDG